MPAHVVVGLHYGDEGKGKIVDHYVARMRDEETPCRIVGRYNGGSNAGHTVKVNGVTYKFNQIPSGILHPKVISVIGCGTVVNPSELVQEIERLKSAGIEVSPENLRVSYRAHVITPECIEEDRVSGSRIETTRKGIGPTYARKALRTGMRMEDFCRANSNEAELLKPYVADAEDLVIETLEAGDFVLAEGAQATFLDIDFGNYPFVTSSHAVAGGACVGLGIPPTEIREIIGVAKICMSRVGEGPFPTEMGDYGRMKKDPLELLDEDGRYWEMTPEEKALVGKDDYQTARFLRRRGMEWGTMTRRPRRLGWPDLVLTRKAARINGITQLAITKVDVFNGIPVKVRIGGSDESPEYSERVYRWDSIIDGSRDLHDELAEFLDDLQNFVGTNVSIVSYGPSREETIPIY